MNNNISCGDGITIENSTGVTISNNILSNNYEGVYLRGWPVSPGGDDWDQNFIVNNNYFLNNYKGIHVGHRIQNVTLDNNTIIGDRVWRNIRGYNASEGIDVRTGNTIISNNLISNTSFGIYSVGSGSIINNTIINGKHGSFYIYNPISQQGHYLPYFAIFIGGEGNQLKGNSVSNNNAGIMLVGSENIITENTIAYNKHEPGICLYTPPGMENFIWHNNIYANNGTSNMYPDDFCFNQGKEISSYSPINLFLNNQGNFWGRTEPPYFCEYGNQHPNCIDNWDSNRPDVIDPCPYDQAYPPGEWPYSPVCPPNQPPVLEPIQDQTLRVGREPHVYYIDISAYDPDPDDEITVYVAYDHIPFLSLNGSNSGNPVNLTLTAKFSSDRPREYVGEYEVKVAVYDNQHEIMDRFNITVIEDYCYEIPDQRTCENPYDESYYTQECKWFPACIGNSYNEFREDHCALVGTVRYYLCPVGSVCRNGWCVAYISPTGMEPVAK